MLMPLSSSLRFSVISGGMRKEERRAGERANQPASQRFPFFFSSWLFTFQITFHGRGSFAERARLARSQPASEDTHDEREREGEGAHFYSPGVREGERDLFNLPNW